MRGRFLLVFGIILTMMEVCMSGSFANVKGLPEIARRVKIYRDTYWVPHIFGETDEACAFGVGYAQAEDNLPRIALSVREATGTLAEIRGEEALEHDYVVRLMRIPQFAYENYHKIPPEFRAVIEAYCDGVNFYVQRHPEKTPQGWRPLTPQDAVALGRYIVLLSFTVNLGVVSDLVERAEERYRFDETGSNMWAVSPKKSANGRAMLVINPHLPWDGLVQWWEVHVKSKEGWNTMGGTFFGAPFIGVGHNEYLGWSHTVNAPDTWDVYRVELNPQNPNQYRYEGRWRDIRVVEERFKVKVEDGFREVSRKLEYTHYGPIVRRSEGHAYTLKVAGWDDVLAMYQWYRMNKARNFEEFREAMRMLAVPTFNVLYADVEGNIFYAYNGKVARKDEKFNWREVVEGGTRETEWGGYLSFDELPQVLNPKAGFVQNCNSTPFGTTAGDDNPRKEDFPGYLTVEGMNPRSQRLRQVLEGKERFTVEDFLRMPWDTWSLVASRTVPYLVEIAEKELADESNPDLLKAVRILSNWDFRATKGSEAMTIFHWWATLYAQRAKRHFAEPDPMGLGVMRGIGEPETAMACLREAVSDIRRRYGGFPIPWGEIHRIRHGDLDLPLAGGDGGKFGMLTALGGRLDEESGKIYVRGGHSYVAVVVFTNPPKAWSIFPYGHNRTDPNSKHYTDQTKLFADFRFKPAWFTEEEIMKNLEKAYHPGEE